MDITWENTAPGNEFPLCWDQLCVVLFFKDSEYYRKIIKSSSEIPIVLMVLLDRHINIYLLGNLYGSDYFFQFYIKDAQCPFISKSFCGYEKKVSALEAEVSDTDDGALIIFTGFSTPPRGQHLVCLSLVHLEEGVVEGPRNVAI